MLRTPNARKNDHHKLRRDLDVVVVNGEELLDSTRNRYSVKIRDKDVAIGDLQYQINELRPN